MKRAITTPRTVDRRRAWRSAAAVPWPVIALLIAMLAPTELSLDVAGLRLPPHRLVLIVLLPVALWRLLTLPSIRIKLFDVAFIAFHLSTVLVFMLHEGSSAGFVYGSSLAIEGMGAYLVARAYIRDAETMQAALHAMIVCIAIAALFALPETIFGKHFVHDFLRDLTGYVHPIGIETRLGLTRAYGVFDHPIHYGTFCAALLAMVWFGTLDQRRRTLRTTLLVAATFLGLSSAPLLCLLVQISLIMWERVTRGVAMRTTLTVVALVGLYAGAAMVMTRSPINLIATGLTLDSWTGFYRMQIWEHGLASVSQHPLLGIGLGSWARPYWMTSDTVDAFWLFVAMRQGIPSFFCLALGIGLIARGVVTKSIRQPDMLRRRLARGWLISLIALTLVGATVHFWNVLFTFFFFFIGAGGWLADPKRVRKNRPVAAAARTGGTAARARHRRPIPGAIALGDQAKPAFA